MAWRSPSVSSTTKATMAGGRDSEDYVASDSTGYCYHHKLVDAQGWVTSDKLVPSC